jgi:Lysozyme like domain/Ricin-type beta-trefoil lectin domain
VIRQSFIAGLTGAIVLGTAWAGAAERPSGAAVSLIPRATGVRLSAAALATAARRCAAWASQSGFADNGYLTGSLATAVAIALAESGCDPSACYDETASATCARHVRPGDSVDRGAWQLNSKNSDRVSAKCAFSGPCAARDAYSSISWQGTYFSRWSTYLTDAYARFLTAAQTAVNALRAGTVTGGLAGRCLGYPSDEATAAAAGENCGSGAAGEQWTVKGSTLRTSGGLCLAASSRSLPAPAVLSICDGSSLQRWLAHADAALYNPAARRCLNDTGAADKPGAVINDSACNGMPDQAWFKP